MNSGWTTLGWVAVVGLPLVVTVAVILWPQRIAKDRTVRAIRRRVEDEASANK
ncbi:hypothetical protein [Nocardia sp. CNY236]|uniref:hypothetical protein n=1 Tax=Nocardia sp. CNY236 TaxID=1169152 RepID=UPI00041D44AE|nr:hypothetical protein [Nocardia sp. CNY236]